MDGRGVLTELAPPLLGVIPRSKVFINGEWRDLEGGNGSRENQIGPIVNLAYNMSILYPEGVNYFIILAVGGTNLYGDWAEGGQQRTQATLAYIEATNSIKNPICQSIFWMQGESDCDLQIEADSYEVNEINLVSYFKDLTKCDYFVSGNIGSIVGFPYLSTVQGAKTNNQNNIITNGLVDTTSYVLKPDNLHFTTDSANLLGKAMFDLYVLNN